MVHLLLRPSITKAQPRTEAWSGTRLFGEYQRPETREPPVAPVLRPTKAWTEGPWPEGKPSSPRYARQGNASIRRQCGTAAIKTAPAWAGGSAVHSGIAEAISPVVILDLPIEVARMGSPLTMATSCSEQATK